MSVKPSQILTFTFSFNHWTLVQPSHSRLPYVQAQDLQSESDVPTSIGGAFINQGDASRLCTGQLIPASAADDAACRATGEAKTADFFGVAIGSRPNFDAAET